MQAPGPPSEVPLPAARHPGPDFLSLYQRLLVGYLISILFLYPYGVPVGDFASLRPPDLFALALLLLGACAILVQGRIHVARMVFAVAGTFVLFEMAAPMIGAMGYRRFSDGISALRMAMLWLPLIMLTMLAPPSKALVMEDRIERILVVTLWLNFAYAMLQIAAAVGAIPYAYLPTTWLEPWTVDKNFNVIQGLRPAGFFANSTALSVFGMVCLCFFYARFVAYRSRRDLNRTLLAVVIVLFSTSRTAYAACAVVLFSGWWLLDGPRKRVVASIVALGALAMLMAVDATVGIEAAFSRFQRLADYGLLADPSFGSRVNRIWPAAIEAARDFRFGTLIQAPRTLPVVDSGYLNYYLQGRWPFVAAVVALIGGLWIIGITAFFGRAAERFGVLSLFLAAYLSLALAIANPLRSPLMAFFIVFVLWRLNLERRVNLAHARPIQRSEFRQPGSQYSPKGVNFAP